MSIFNTWPKIDSAQLPCVLHVRLKGSGIIFDGDNIGVVSLMIGMNFEVRTVAPL